MSRSGWTLSDAPPQTGRVAVVTGANSGIGRATAFGLATLGARVVLACRNEKTAAEAADEIAATVPGADLDVVQLDLSELASVRRAAGEIIARHTTIDLLVNNAGVMRGRRELTADGFEMDFGTNFLGHFVWTHDLLQRISVGGRVITVGSHAHRTGVVDFNDLTMGRRFTSPAAYSRSKLAQLLFAFELDRRLSAASMPVLSLAAHPGGTRTGVMREQNRFLQWAYFAPSLRWLTDRFIMDPPEGMLSILRAATDPKAVGGQYYGPTGRLGLAGPPVLVRPAERALDRDVAARLWTVAEELTGVRYDLADGDQK